MKERALGMSRHLASRMVWIHAKVGEKKLFPTRAVTPAVRLNRNEYGIDLIQRFWIVELQHPSFLADAVFVENPEVEGLCLVRPSPPPRLERTGVLQPRLLVQIVGVENERFPSCVEDAPVSL